MSKILFVSSNDWEPWGGSEELWSRAAAEMRRRGHEVSVSVGHFGAPVPNVSALAAMGCRVHRRRLRKFPRLHTATQRAFTSAKSNYFDGVELVVISQGLNFDGLVWMVESRRRGLRYVVVSQAASDSVRVAGRTVDALSNAYENAAASFFVSRANLELTQRQIGQVLPRAAIIRNPFSVEYERAIPWPSVDAEDELRLACVGRLHPASKGQDLVLEVLSRTVWRGRAVSVSFFGKGQAERLLRRIADRAGLASIHFRGFADDVSAIWRDHHALLLPSRYEGMPLAVVEAMLTGRPVVVTDVAGNREVVDDDVTGFLARTSTVEDVDEAMTRAWERRASLREMGARAAERIRELVPADPASEFADRLEELLKT